MTRLKYFCCCEVRGIVAKLTIWHLGPAKTQLSRVMRKPALCICENKDADQLCGNREADQRLCFRYTDSTIPLLPTFEISNLWPSSLAVQPCLCRTWSETPKTSFLTTRLKLAWTSIQSDHSLQCQHVESLAIYIVSTQRKLLSFKVIIHGQTVYRPGQIRLPVVREKLIPKDAYRMENSTDPDQITSLGED